MPWRASVSGGVIASALVLLSSWAGAYYVQQIAHLRRHLWLDFGGVVIFLVWLSWNVTAVFYGGAVATEMELAILHEPEAEVDASGGRGAELVFSMVKTSVRSSSRTLSRVKPAWFAKWGTSMRASGSSAQSSTRAP